MDYKKAGVDIEKGDLFVEKIKSMIGETYDQRVISGVGGFAALYEIDEERLLAAGTDGVGTKVKIAQELGIHHTIGQDLVAMCVNDVICTGARPLFFLDYLATGKLDVEVGSQIVSGIARACKEAKCALIGGETAEMPGVYADGVYDLAGFSVGEVFRQDWIDGSQAAEGQYLIGIPSSGFHSNGYSLVRKLLKDSDRALKEKALTPTRIYVDLVHSFLNNQRKNLTGIAHITGGGIHNIPRIQEELGYELTGWPTLAQIPAFMSEIVSRAQMTEDQLFETFNMGVGLVLLVKDFAQAETFLKNRGEAFYVLGKTTSKFSGVRLTK